MSYDTPADIVIIHTPAGTRRRWIQNARPGKLSAWVVKMIDEPADPRRYVDRAIEDLPYTREELAGMLADAYLAGARRE